MEGGMLCGLKVRLKRWVPPSLLNQLLLAFPALYRTRLVNYETNFTDPHGVPDLLSQLELVLDLPGDVVECGCSRCGASAIMGQYLQRRGVQKTVFALDSFQGFDRAELLAERTAGLTITPDDAFTSTSFEYVCDKLSALGLYGAVRPVPGYFCHTLPTLGRRPVCLALIDCDLRDSITLCAEHLWPLLPPGGLLVFDDYKIDIFAGARLAVDDFVAAHTEQIARHGLLNRLYAVQKGDPAGAEKNAVT